MKATAHGIKAAATPMAESMFKEFETLKMLYWDMHEELSKTEFPSHWEANQAIEKLSQLGLALKAYGDAYSAISQVRSIS